MNTAMREVEFALPHGIRLACRASGPIDAPLLVFLHGFPQGAFIWDELLQHFGARFHCIAPNLRGYAASSSPPETEAYRAKHLVADVAALIEAAGAPAEAVIAHDWGGALAWGLAIGSPHLLRRLVVLNAPHPGPFLRDLQDDPAQQAASAYMNFFCRPDAEALLAQDDYARMWPLLTRMGGGAWLDDAARACHRAVWSGGLTGPLNYYRASPLRPPTPSDPAVRAIRFEHDHITVQVPTTVIWGEADTALLPNLLDGLGAWVPRLELVRVAEASHWILHEQPLRVRQEIEAALAR